MKQYLVELGGEIDKFTIVVGNLTLLSVIDKIIGRKPIRT